MLPSIHLRGTSRSRQVIAAFGLIAIVAGVIAVASTSSPNAAAGGDVPTARSIIDKAIEFHGGLKNLSRDVPIIRTEESEMIMEGDKINVKCEWQYQPPDKRASQAVVKVGSLSLRVTQGLVGGKGWIKVGPALAVDLTPEQVLGLTW